MSGGPEEVKPRRGALMRFGPAPNVLGVVGGIAGGVAAAVFQAKTGSSETGGLLGIIGGVVFGLGAGWLAGLILAMGWLGD